MSDSKVIITDHSRERTKDRLGISKKLAAKKAEEALKWGITHKDVTGNLHRYLTYLFHNSKTVNNIRIYHRKVYLFRRLPNGENILVTILHLPSHLYEIADKVQRRKKEEIERAE